MRLEKQVFTDWCNVVHNGRMSTKTSPPTTIRLTIPVDLETHATFQRLAKVSNMSTGRAMGEWLRDTVEAAELMVSTMERARASPKIVTAELHAMMLGMADSTKELQDKFAKFKSTPMVRTGATAGGRAATPDQDASGSSSPNPPPSNTGGKGRKDKQGKTKGTP